MARQKILASCPSVWLSDCSPSVSNNSTYSGAPGVEVLFWMGAPHSQMPLVQAWTEEPTPKPESWPASWFRMYDLPARRRRRGVWAAQRGSGGVRQAARRAAPERAGGLGRRCVRRAAAGAASGRGRTRAVYSGHGAHAHRPLDGGQDHAALITHDKLPRRWVDLYERDR